MSDLLFSEFKLGQLLLKNRIFLDRLEGVGAMSPELAISYGWTGPCLRSTGIAYDVRKAHPYSVYDRFDFEVPVLDSVQWAALAITGLGCALIFWRGWSVLRTLGACALAGIVVGLLASI